MLVLQGMAKKQGAFLSFRRELHLSLLWILNRHRFVSMPHVHVYVHRASALKCLSRVCTHVQAGLLCNNATNLDPQSNTNRALLACWCLTTLRMGSTMSYGPFAHSMQRCLTCPWPAAVGLCILCMDRKCTAVCHGPVMLTRCA